jgi:hypothetical protein
VRDRALDAVRRGGRRGDEQDEGGDQDRAHAPVVGRRSRG